MESGTVKKINDRGFGFIDTGNREDLFFHSSAVVEGRFDELREGSEVIYEIGRGQKGPCAENVRICSAR